MLSATPLPIESLVSSTNETRERGLRGKSVDVASADPSPAHQRRTSPLFDRWGHEIVDRLSRRNAWTVATATSVAWVVIAFIFTFINSTEDKAEGHATNTLWLWLLCLVTGWLWIPTFICGELNSVLHQANHKAVNKAAK